MEFFCVRGRPQGRVPVSVWGGAKGKVLAAPRRVGRSTSGKWESGESGTSAPARVIRSQVRSVWAC